MGPIKKKDENETSKKEGITMEVKEEMTEKHERGMRVSVIMKWYKVNDLHNSEEVRIKRLDAAKRVTRVSKQWPRILEEENFLLLWIKKSI